MGAAIARSTAWRHGVGPLRQDAGDAGERVQAVMDWVHENVTFGYQYARHNKTAFDDVYEQQGVCRDFQHLAITFLRALNVPARYATGYLGDIGVPRDPFPMDFSAWMEVYLGGHGTRWTRAQRAAHRSRPDGHSATRPTLR